MDLNRRTEQGALLRSGLAAIEKQALSIPPGKRLVVAAVTDGHDVEVGAAFLTARGWTIEASVSAAIRDGRRLQASVKFIG